MLSLPMSETGQRRAFAMQVMISFAFIVTELFSASLPHCWRHELSAFSVRLLHRGLGLKYSYAAESACKEVSRNFRARQQSKFGIKGWLARSCGQRISYKPFWLSAKGSWARRSEGFFEDISKL